MSERKCKRCGTIDFGIWGYIGLLGWSLSVAACGYALALVFANWNLPFVLIVFGLCLWLPMYFISIQERKENKE